MNLYVDTDISKESAASIFRSTCRSIYRCQNVACCFRLQDITPSGYFTRFRRIRSCRLKYKHRHFLLVFVEQTSRPLILVDVRSLVMFCQKIVLRGLYCRGVYNGGVLKTSETCVHIEWGLSRKFYYQETRWPERINESSLDTSNELKDRVVSFSTFSVPAVELLVSHNWRSSHVLATGSLNV